MTLKTKIISGIVAVVLGLIIFKILVALVAQYAFLAFVGVGIIWGLYMYCIRLSRSIISPSSYCGPSVPICK